MLIIVENDYAMSTSTLTGKKYASKSNQVKKILTVLSGNKSECTKRC